MKHFLCMLIDWGNDLDTRKSVKGFAVFVNSNPLSWVSRDQRTVSIESVHAEYNVISDICQEILYINYLMVFFMCETKFTSHHLL